MTTTTSDRLLTIKEVSEMVGLSIPTIYRRRREGMFPEQVHPGGCRASRWRLSDIETWMADL